MAFQPVQSNEYCNQVRLEPGRTVPSGFTLISATAPAVLTQLSRTFTFARGFTLYEIWDDWNQTATGYMVPSFIAALASEYKNGISVERWNSLPLHQRNRLKHARGLLLERFPRMPEIAVTRVAERAQLEHWSGEKQKLEARVVNHVRHEWTSYEMRLDFHARSHHPTANTTTTTRQGGAILHRKKDEILEIVKPRIRDVLISWLPKDVGAEDFAKLWQRYRLFDSTDGDGAYREPSVLVQTSCLRYHGGLETPANLLARTELIM